MVLLACLETAVPSRAMWAKTFAANIDLIAWAVDAHLRDRVVRFSVVVADTLLLAIIIRSILSTVEEAGLAEGVVRFVVIVADTFLFAIII